MKRKLALVILCLGIGFSLMTLKRVETAEAIIRVDNHGNLESYQSQVLGVADNRRQGPPDDVAGAEKSAQAKEQSRNQEQVMQSDQEKATPYGLIRQAEKRPVEMRIRPKKDALEIVTLVEDDKYGTGSAEETEVIEIDEHKSKQTTRIRSKDNAAIIIRDRIASRSRFPLMVNLETNELIVTTPAGTKIVTILPDAAVRNMLAANVLDQIGGKGGIRWLDSVATPSATPVATESGEIDDTDQATESGEIDDTDQATDSAAIDPDNDVDEATPSAEETSNPELEDEVEEVDTVIELTTDEEGRLVYEISGSKEKKLFGFYRVRLERKAIVSAETGALLQIEQDWRTSILDFLSR